MQAGTEPHNALPLLIFFSALAVWALHEHQWFEPRVLGIQTRQQFEVTNSDPVTHNIHPRARVLRRSRGSSRSARS